MTHVPWVIWASLFAVALLLVAGVLVRSRLAGRRRRRRARRGLQRAQRRRAARRDARRHGRADDGPQVAHATSRSSRTLFFFILIANLLGLIPGLGGATTQRERHVGLGDHLLRRAPVRRHQGARLARAVPRTEHLRRSRRPHVHVRCSRRSTSRSSSCSHLSRVFTLAVRLLANMFADHIVVGVWLALVPVVDPGRLHGPRAWSSRSCRPTCSRCSR